MDEHRAMKVTPDRYLTYRYAGASGDYNPIHLDDEFARSVGLPGRILHGLWTMAQVARVASGDDPLALKSLSVQFRGLGVPEKEIAITSKLKSTSDGEAVFDCEAVQDGNKLVRRGRAVLKI